MRTDLLYCAHYYYLFKMILMHVILSDRRERRISPCAEQLVSRNVTEILRLHSAALRSGSE
jgi:hypothetical protein